MVIKGKLVAVKSVAMRTLEFDCEAMWLPSVGKCFVGLGAGLERGSRVVETSLVTAVMVEGLTHRFTTKSGSEYIFEVWEATCVT